MVARNRIGIDSFSYHRYFGEVGPFDQPPDQSWTTIQFLRHAVELGVEIVSLQTAYLTDDDRAVLPDWLKDLGLSAILAWGHPDGLGGGTDPARLDECLDNMAYAKSLGCPLMRIVSGNHYTWSEAAEVRIARIMPMLQSLVVRADELDIDLAWENHADFTVPVIVAAIEQVNSPRLGMCFDIANADRVGNDILEVVKLALPHIRMVHCRDIIRPEARHDPTAFWAAVPLGKGELPLVECFAYLLQHAESLPYFVEASNLYPTYTDEERVVIESLAWLRELVLRS